MFLYHSWDDQDLHLACALPGDFWRFGDLFKFSIKNDLAHNRSAELATRYAKTTCVRILIDSGCPKHVYTDRIMIIVMKKVCHLKADEIIHKLSCID